jgi:6-pyruvoyltetrahydropterin/6-carboxytetrahydropterin synthase
MNLSVCKSFTFDAAHRLPNYDGHCANLHGHQWTLEVEVWGPVQEDSGMVLDFMVLKKMVYALVIDALDHRYLNEIYSNPTAELMLVNIAEHLKNGLNGRYPEVILRRVRLYESPGSFAEWNGEV